MVSEPRRGRSARVLSLRRERPLQRPAVSSGVGESRCRSIEAAVSVKDAVNQGGTTEVLRFRPCGLLPAEDESVFLLPVHEAQKNVPRGAKTIV